MPSILSTPPFTPVLTHIKQLSAKREEISSNQALSTAYPSSLSMAQITNTEAQQHSSSPQLNPDWDAGPSTSSHQTTLYPTRHQFDIQKAQNEAVIHTETAAPVWESTLLSHIRREEIWFPELHQHLPSPEEILTDPFTSDEFSIAHDGPQVMRLFSICDDKNRISKGYKYISDGHCLINRSVIKQYERAIEENKPIFHYLCTREKAVIGYVDIQDKVQDLRMMFGVATYTVGNKMAAKRFLLPVFWAANQQIFCITGEEGKPLGMPKNNEPMYINISSHRVLAKNAVFFAPGSNGKSLVCYQDNNGVHKMRVITIPPPILYSHGNCQYGAQLEASPWNSPQATEYLPKRSLADVISPPPSFLENAKHRMQKMCDGVLRRATYRLEPSQNPLSLPVPSEHTFLGHF